MIQRTHISISAIVQHKEGETESLVEGDDEEDEDMVPMIDPATGEWGGPTKGGTFPEPTRYGDWERQGRCSDFR